jgi:hypothetical protein
VRQLTKLLSDGGRLSPDVAGRLDRIAKALNAAVHGLDMSQQDANAAFEEATQILNLVRESGNKND